MIVLVERINYQHILAMPQLKETLTGLKATSKPIIINGILLISTRIAVLKKENKAQGTKQNQK